MRVSCEPVVSNYYMDKLQAVPEDLRPLTLGFNSLQAVHRLLSEGIVEPRKSSDNYYIIPESIDRLITGFVLVHPIFGTTSRISWKDGGVCLGHTARHANYSYNNIFIFQDPLLALRIFFNFLILENSVAAIMASPFMDIESIYEWLPRRELVLVLKQYAPEKYRHLKPLRPKIVSESVVNSVSQSPAELLIYLANAKPLEEELTTSVALTAKTTIVSQHHAWYAMPSTDLALNVNIQIQRIHKYRQTYRYIGRILANNKQIPFKITGKHRFYSEIAELCADAGIALYCMPSLKKHLADVAAALSYPVKTKRYKPRITKNKVVLPNVIITGSRICNTHMGFKDEPAGRVRLYTRKVSLKPTTQGQAEHLLFFFAFCCAIGRYLYLKQKTDIAILGNPGQAAEHILEQLSVPIHDPSYNEDSGLLWPTAYRSFSLSILQNRYSKIYFVNELQALVAMYLSRGLIFGLSDNPAPLFSEKDINSSLCLWIQKCLTRRDDPFAIKRRRNDYYYIFLKEFAKLFDIGEDAENFILANLKKSSVKQRKNTAAAIIRQLIFEGALPENELRKVDVHEFIVPKARINEILQELGLPPIFLVTEGKKEMFKLHNSTVFRCPLSTFSSIKPSTMNM